MAQSVSAATITLTWDDPNPAGTVSEYRVERSTIDQQNWQQVGIVPVPTRNYVDSDVNSSHCYRVSAAEGIRVSYPSEVACVPLFEPTNVRITITLSGTAQ